MTGLSSATSRSPARTRRWCGSTDGNARRRASSCLRQSGRRSWGAARCWWTFSVTGTATSRLDFGYRLEDHARTIVALIDALGPARGRLGRPQHGWCHRNPGRRPRGPLSCPRSIMAEGNLGPEGDDGLDGLSEDEVRRARVPRPAREPGAGCGDAPRQPPGGSSRHHPSRGASGDLPGGGLDGTRDDPGPAIDPGLPSTCRRWYLKGELSDPDLEVAQELSAHRRRVEGRPPDGTSDGPAEPGGAGAGDRRGAARVLGDVSRRAAVG